jgi:hypothetical protein
MGCWASFLASRAYFWQPKTYELCVYRSASRPDLQSHTPQTGWHRSTESAPVVHEGIS